MKKLILILLFILLSSFSFASDVTLTGGTCSIALTGGSSTIANTVTCPSGTYLFAWDGDYTSDTDKGCFTNGTIQKDGTQSGGTLSSSYGRTGVGFRITDENQYVTWAISGGDGIDINDGTIWIDIYISDTEPDAVTLFECYIDSRNFISVVFNQSNGITGTYRGTNIGKTVIGSEDLHIGWNRIAYSWQKTGTDKHSVKIEDHDWQEEVEGFDAFESAPTSISIGESGSGTTHTDTVYIDNVYVLTGYQTAHP